MSIPNPKTGPESKINPQQYQRLRAEVAHPYRGLRLFLYIAFASSGFIGGVIFLAQAISGQDLATTLPNLALQIGVVALMIFLWRWDTGKGNQGGKGRGDV